jgi:hypothetical protein
MPVVIGSWFIVSAALGIAERFASSLRSAVAGDKQEGRGRIEEGRAVERARGKGNEARALDQRTNAVKEGEGDSKQPCIIDLGCKCSEVITRTVRASPVAKILNRIIHTPSTAASRWPATTGRPPDRRISRCYAPFTAIDAAQ